MQTQSSSNDNKKFVIQIQEGLKLKAKRKEKKKICKKLGEMSRLFKLKHTYIFTFENALHYHFTNKVL